MYTNQKWDINPANKQEVNAFNGVNIADCSKSIMITNEEKEANALLISKARELLEFLEKYYRFLNLNDQEKAKQLIDSCRTA